jgi:sulfotransferase family protein
MRPPPSIALAQRVRQGVVYRGRGVLARSQREARRLSARARLRPNYLVIGAQKAGTSSLHLYLSHHPAVQTARVKEVEYFTRHYARGERWYLSQFPFVPRSWAASARTGVTPVVGEATAACLFDPRSPGRVYDFDPSMKLIVLLRDPVDRAYSHFQMERRWGRETGTFEEALAREEAELPAVLERIRERPLSGPPGGFACSYVARGRYAEQLERWLHHFDREQLLILMSVELSCDPAGTMEVVTEFLGIPPVSVARYGRRGVQRYDPMSPETRERLEEAFAPHDRRLSKLLGRDLPWTRSRTDARS